MGHPLADRAQIPVAGLDHENAVMFPVSPFAGIWQRTVDHLLPRGAQPGQVVVEPDLINSPEAMLRAVAKGSGVAPGDPRGRGSHGPGRDRRGRWGGSGERLVEMAGPIHPTAER